MSHRTIRRQPAVEDLADQAAWYIAHAGQAVSDRFLAAVERSLALLADMPGTGAPRPRLNPALRGLRMHPVRGFEGHLIFYRPIRDGIELVRVLHAAQDVDAILSAEPDPEDGEP